MTSTDRPRKRNRVENARRTRQALLKAALGVVARHGYKKSSVSRITQAAGVAQGTLYSYFETHNQLLAELVPSETTSLIEALQGATEGAEDFFDHERRAFLAFAEYLRKSPYLLRVLTESEIAAPESHAGYLRAVEGLQLTALQAARARGEVRSESERAFWAIAEVLAGARSHIAIGLSDRVGRVFRQQIPASAVDTYVAFVRNGLGGSVPERLTPRREPGREAASVDARDMRTRLLEAGARVIHEVGFAGASVAVVTRRAGVALATFYAYFASRQIFFDDVLTHVREAMLAEVGRQVRGSRSFVEVECRGFVAFFDYIHRNPWYIRIETEAALWAPVAYRRHFHHLADLYVASMRRSRDRGELAGYAEHDLPVLAFTMMAARHYLANRFVLASPSPDRLPSWVANAYIRFVAEGLAK
jgi:AcrR family transcriptional regulator